MTKTVIPLLLIRGCASIIIILAISSCDTFKEDVLLPENQVVFSETEYYTLPGKSVLIDLKTIVRQSYINATLEITQRPNRGDLTSSDTLLLKYTPRTDFTEDQDQLVLSVRSSGKIVTSETVTITMLNNTDEFPCGSFAVEDRVVTRPDVPVTIKYLDNDRVCGVARSSVERSVHLAPKHGQAVLAGDSIVYTPDSGFNGTDEMVYKIATVNGENSNLSFAVIKIVINQPPVANAGPDKAISLRTNYVNLDGTDSSDPDNDITGYVWNQLSGPSTASISSANSPQTQVSNFVAGVYKLELKVTDAEGSFSKDTMQLTVTPGQEPPACTNCEIVFVSNRDGNNEIYTCNADGSNVTRLTTNTYDDGAPAWSPDGTMIAYVSSRNGRYEIYIMNADGSNVVQRTSSASHGANPTWSPDGTMIAYSDFSNGSNNISVVGAASGSPSLLFSLPGWEAQPAWSPNGSKIALVSDWQAYDFVFDVYIINSDGTNLTGLVGDNMFDNINYYSPSWSNDGEKLAVCLSSVTGIDQYTLSLGVCNADGSNLTSIITINEGVSYAWTRTTWSADGTRIAYTVIDGSQRSVAWISVDGTASGTIITNGWDADWQHVMSAGRTGG